MRWPRFEEAPRPALLVAVGLVAAGCSAGRPNPRPPPPPSVPVSAGSPPSGELRLCVQEGSSENCLLGDRRVSAHVVATSGTEGRLVVAFPAANSGAALWLAAPEGQRVTLRLARPPSSVAGGVRFQLETSTPLTVKQVILGSIRIIRDYQHQRTLASLDGPVERLTSTLEQDAELGRAVARLGLTPAELRRRTRPARTVRRARSPAELEMEGSSLDGKHRLTLRLTAPTGHWRAEADTLAFGATPAKLEILVTTSYPQLLFRPAEQLLRPAALERLRALGFDDDSKTLLSLEFLASDRKYLAGSWRFLTYFGRDTLMTIWLMLPLLRAEAVEVGLQSVLDRLSPEGRVAHEESLGDQAAVERLQLAVSLLRQGRRKAALDQLRRLGQPVYDYKMVDDLFMLPCVLAAYLDQSAVTAAGARRFLGRPGNLEALRRNVAHVVARARSQQALVGLLDGSATGDWRDSQEGLGGGRYPASVNLYLVPAALEALGRLRHHPKLAPGALRLPLTARELESLKQRWRAGARRFRVTLNADELRRRVGRYLRLGARSELERRLLREAALEEGLTVADLLQGKLPAALASGLSFDALALLADGRPVQVMHSDDGFAMLAGEIDLEELGRRLVKYELPFPVGLLDAQGVYVANPALSDRVEDYSTFDRGHYHGTVVWSWQLGMLQLGLVRQLRRLMGVDGSRAQVMVRRLRRLLGRLGQIKRRVGPLRDSELWSVAPTEQGFQARAYGHGAGQTTESNALQLWSVVHLAVDHAYADLGISTDQPGAKAASGSVLQAGPQ